MKPVLRRITNVGSCDYVVPSNHLFPRIRSLLGGKPDCCYLDEFALPTDFFMFDPANEQLLSNCQIECEKWPGKAIVWMQQLEEAFDSLARVLQCPNEERRTGFLYTFVGYDSSTKGPENFAKKIQKKVARHAPGFVEMEWPEDNDAMAKVQEAFRRYVPVSKKPISVERDRRLLKKEKLGPVFSSNFYREAGCSAGLTIMVTVHLVHGADGKAHRGTENYDVAITVMDNTHDK
ncbi:unnamed protein product, partial [Mesorhabditis spiculigera]